MPLAHRSREGACGGGDEVAVDFSYAIVQLLLATTTLTPTVTLGEFLISLIPWLLILGFVIVVFWGTRRQYRINAQHVKRMRLHMAAVEAKLDRLIELSERAAGFSSARPKASS